MDLKVIENESVPVYETDKGIKVVNGRELHHILQSGQDFSTWVKKRRTFPASIKKWKPIMLL